MYASSHLQRLGSLRAWRHEGLAKNRIIADPDEVVQRDSEIIIGSWCGKPFKLEDVTSRPGWNNVKAVRNHEVHEIDSSIILQPGPAALTDGVRTIERIVTGWRKSIDPKSTS